MHGCEQMQSIQMIQLLGGNKQDAQVPLHRSLLGKGVFFLALIGI
jgi:hypothetical protein